MTAKETLQQQAVQRQSPQEPQNEPKGNPQLRKQEETPRLENGNSRPRGGKDAHEKNWQALPPLKSAYKNRMPQTASRTKSPQKARRTANLAMPTATANPTERAAKPKQPSKTVKAVNAASILSNPPEQDYIGFSEYCQDSIALSEIRKGRSCAQSPSYKHQALAFMAQSPSYKHQALIAISASGASPLLRGCPALTQ